MTQVSKTFLQHQWVQHDILLEGSGLLLCFVAHEIDDLKHFPSSSTRKGASSILFISSGIAAWRELEKSICKMSMGSDTPKSTSTGADTHNFLEDSWTHWRNKHGKLNKEAWIALGCLSKQFKITKPSKRMVSRNLRPFLPTVLFNYVFAYHGQVYKSGILLRR